MCKEFSQQLVPFLFSISFFFVSRKLLGILRTHFISCPRMEKVSNFLSTTRYALVTGGNKGIGFEICKQLASQGVRVVLTARDEKRGLEAVEKLLKESGLTDHFVFHQLDVVDPSSVASVADFVNTKFGKLDILINNAGVGGVILDADAFARAAELAGGGWPKEGNWSEIEIPTYEKGEECLKTNYYGSKTMIEAFLPLLQASDSARVVNVSSLLGLLKNIPNEWAKGILSDVENLSEERIDEVLREFLKDMKDGMVETKGWPKHLSAYKLSKAALNAYTRVLAKRYKKICFNSVCPGYVKTDITCNTGQLTVAEGAQSVVKLALLPNDKLNSGHFFHRQQVSSF